MLFPEGVFINMTTRWQLLSHWIFTSPCWYKRRMCAYSDLYGLFGEGGAHEKQSHNPCTGSKLLLFSSAPTSMSLASISPLSPPPTEAFPSPHPPELTGSCQPRYIQFKKLSQASHCCSFSSASSPLVSGLTSS